MSGWLSLSIALNSLVFSRSTPSLPFDFSYRHFLVESIVHTQRTQHESQQPALLLSSSSCCHSTSRSGALPPPFIYFGVIRFSPPPAPSAYFALLLLQGTYPCLIICRICLFMVNTNKLTKYNNKIGQ